METTAEFRARVEGVLNDAIAWYSSTANDVVATGAEILDELHAAGLVVVEASDD